MAPKKKSKIISFVIIIIIVKVIQKLHMKSNFDNIQLHMFLFVKL